MRPASFPRLLELRIGLTDVAKRAAGSDSSLSQGDFRPDCLSEKIRRHRPQIVAFTSKAAWRAWKRRLRLRRRSRLWLAALTPGIDRICRAAIALRRGPRLLGHVVLAGIGCPTNTGAVCSS